MKKIFKIISFIALIITLSYPIFIAFNSETDLILKIINIILFIGSIYFLYTIWENHKQFDSNVKYIINNGENINEKYKQIYILLKKYLNL